MSLKNFYQELSKGLLSPVYLISSQEDFLLYESLTLIKDKLHCADSINFSQYDLDSSESSVSIKEIVGALNTPPFFGDRRIVVLRNIQKLPKKDFKRLTGYLSNPADFSLFVMMCQGDCKKIFNSEMLKNIKVIIINIIGDEIYAWIREKAKKKDIELTESALEYLLSTVGDDLFMLNAEIEKLSLIGKKVVDTIDIKESVYEGVEFNAFDLARALERGDKKLAFKIYYNLEKSTDLYMLLGALNWHYRKLYDKTSGKEKGKYFKIFKLFHDTDVAIKTSQGFVFENLLIKMLQVGSKAQKQTP